LTEAIAVRLVLDQGVPRDAAALLRGFGYECIHGSDLDADFHTILAVSGAGQPSVIRFRVQGLRARETVGLVQQVLAVFADDLRRGALITVKTRKTTCHRLPIGGPE
jgi:hypothetical protein